MVEKWIKTKPIDFAGLGMTSVCDWAAFEENLPAMVQALGVPVALVPVGQGVLLTFVGIDGDESRLLVRLYDVEKISDALDAEVLRAPSLR